MRTLLLVPLLLILALGQTTKAPPVARAPPVSLKDRANQYLDQGLQDKNPDTRKTAVQALSLVGAREPYLTKLASMLDDKDVETRLAAITSLVDLKSRQALPALRKALGEDGVPEVEFAAAKALYALKDPVGKEALLAALGKEMKTSSGFITKKSRDTIRMLHTPRPLLMFALKQGAAVAPVPGLGEGISSLQGILNDPGVSGRAATALLLAGDKDPRVLVALRDALEDKDGSVRAAAAHAIALRNDPSSEPLLIPLLDDKKASVRLRASAACLRLELIRSEARQKRAVKTANP
jgi:HEAT repeat protein